ncbi:hypothetical protein AAFG07_33295 [Bradyrhizobium sp. B097]|uniref:hypothetical protein n=1 Tax=Bradyrhizobium sp. B097 TaxID=3140244 RepID=UPI00318441BB
MESVATARAAKRTAVLVVHGMGSQRPLETVRGIVDAVWLKGSDAEGGRPRIWTHPEKSGVDDIDLPVVTTNRLSGSPHRQIDFHELYWAHLMSETRAVAVLLWLFELARMGPRLKPSIAPLYWVALIFLSALVLSISLVTVQAVVEFSALIADATTWPLLSKDLHSLLYVFFVAIGVTALLAFLAALWKGAVRLAAIVSLIVAVFVGGFILTRVYDEAAHKVVMLSLPTVLAAGVIRATMGRWGLAGLIIVVGLSCLAALQAGLTLGWDALGYGHGPWSIFSFWSTIAAFYLIALYLVLYAVFLQPYLGDAARYFRNSPGNVAVRREIRRQAVRTLQDLHVSGKYDRIIVVAHSLGTVVAYDMLRSYYSRIKDALPDPALLGKELDDIDHGGLPKFAARASGRELVRRISRIVADTTEKSSSDKIESGDSKMRAWLVTDFVTLGSPLTHAPYLMCRGKNEEQLRIDFDRRVADREFPTCPPRLLDGDCRLTFANPNTGRRQFHHGGLFALTRWTNLYFPASQLLWGDGIGGELGALFGDTSGSNIADVPVYTNKMQHDTFFAHVRYWDDLGSKNPPPHIEALRNAIDLADVGAADTL